MNKNVVIFGADSIGVKILNLNHYNVLAFSDNNEELWNKDINGIEIIPPSSLNSIREKIDGILIASSRIDEIKEQLKEEGLIKYVLEEESLHWIIKLQGSDTARKDNPLEQIRNNPNKDIKIVFTPAKVGTRSIVESIKEPYAKGVIKTHSFRYEKSFDKYLVNFNTFNSSAKPDDLERKKEEIKELKKQKNIKILTLVREPLSRQISAFFNCLHLFIDERDINNLTTTHLIDLFNEYSDINSYFRWFDDEIRDFFDIDIYDYPFDKEKGFTIIEKNDVQLFLGKLENFNCYVSYMENFLNVGELNFSRRNNALKKWYGNLYEGFKKSFALDKDELSKIYDQNFVKHFYTTEEVENFKEKFLVKNKKNG